MKSPNITFRPTKGNEDIKEKMEKLATQDNRNLNNYIEVLFLMHLEENKKKLEKQPS